MKKYNISKAGLFLGVTSQTLRNWDKEGKLKPSFISESGYRYYLEEDLINFKKNNLCNYKFDKLGKSKVFRDPLYGNIPVDYQIIWDLIDTKEFQRLRRIRQLSGVAMVFHTAEHTRFGHALGTYHIANRMINEVNDIKNNFSEYEKIVFLVSALLHDVGHGPFSHAFEHVFDVKHEVITCQMIESKNTEINKVLSKYPGLASDVSGVIKHDGKYLLVESLISSQLDVDRLDYLNRDAHFTGATYGVVDVDRLIRIMRIKNNRICYVDKGVHAIENYLMSRYHMYWQIYYHPVARSYEIILESIYKRIKDMIVSKQKIEANVDSLTNVFLNKDLESYIDIDDTYVNGMIKQLTKSKDRILSDLCNAFMNRRLFKYKHLKDNEENDIINAYKKDDVLFKYYYKEDVVTQTAYLNYLNYGIDTDVNNIFVLKEQELIPLDEFSPIVEGLLHSGFKKEVRIFYGLFNEGVKKYV
jgi:HD superfamily phosphohydrolase